MPKINVYLPDELAEAVRDAGVPVSTVCQRALEHAVRRITAIRETTLAELDAGDPTGRMRYFTDRARTAVRLGVEKAHADGLRRVGTAHLLHGLLAEGGNLALQVLVSLEIEPRQVARELAGQQSAAEAAEVSAVGETYTVAEAAEAGEGRQFTDTAAAALELTVSESSALGHNFVGCEHLLLGLIAEPEGTAGQVLRAMGAEPRLTRRAVAAALAGYVHLRAQLDPPPPPAGTDATRQAAALGTAVRAELRPVIQRLERLEAGLAAITAGQRDQKAHPHR